MSDPIDLVSDAALSALVDGELSPEEERSLRERISEDPALAARLTRFEALNRALRTESETGVSESLSAGLAARIAADRSPSDGLLELDDAPPVFSDEGSAGADSLGAAEVVALPLSRRVLRLAVPLAAAAAAAFAVYLVASGPGGRGAGGAAPEAEVPLIAEEAAIDPQLPTQEPEARGPANAERELAVAPPVPAPAPPAVPDAEALAPPTNLAASDPASTGGDEPTRGVPERAREERLAAAQPSDPSEAGAAIESELELYALALDDEVVGPDFDVIDNLELLELLAALDAEATRG